MENSFVAQPSQTGPPGKDTDFDRILASIQSGISDYLYRPQTVAVAVVPPAPAVTAAAANTSWLFLLVIAVGVYALVR